MSGIIQCQEYLIQLAEKQGYLTFDNILDASDNFSLSVTDVDFLSEAIQIRGILVYENAPQEKLTAQTDEDYLDYSRTDYDAVFSEILSMAPQLEKFINEIRDYPPPQYGEIRLLAMQISENNQYARERMISLFIRNVMKIALSMSKQYDLDIEEAISSGFLGLINAVDRYDPSGFSVFHSYVSLWIQQCIQRFCIPVWMDYYFPFNYREKMSRCIRRWEYYRSIGTVKIDTIDETIARISLDCELHENIVRKVLHNYFIQIYGKTSYEELKDRELGGEEHMPRRLISNDASMLNRYFRKERSLAIKEVLDSLSERERDVIKMRYGIGCRGPMTLEDIGAIYGVTRERVRQIEVKAMEKLAHPKRKRKLKPFL